VNQAQQLNNPDARIVLEASANATRLSEYADSVEGMSTGDSERYLAMFWEISSFGETWECFQRSPDTEDPYSGARAVVRWESGNGTLAVSPEARVQGFAAWGKRGVLVNMMRHLNMCLSVGAKHDKITAVIVPKNNSSLLPIWTFCSSGHFFDEVRKLNPALQPGTGTLVKVPFDLAHWQKVAAEKYPNGLPKPFSSDPSQWLFNGHPKGSDHPLQVAVARLVGYQWPRQSGSSFPDCPALKQDGLVKHEDTDGIVCFSQSRDEAPAAPRLRALLAEAFGAEWGHALERKLISATGSKAESLEDWLVNDFFEQHCDIFHNRPFVWHLWDGRKDGFNALVNYHQLAGPDGDGARTLETLTFAYLGDWIGRQRDAVKHEEAGAEDRLAAALELQGELKKIVAGEPPHDLFIRWKAMADQPIGWNPDLNDGVRLNIRPFLAVDLSRGKRSAGLFRVKFNVKWDKDRGKEPSRPKADFPWFWNGSTFTGDRVNDVHLTNAQKLKAREK
jgi:hypothetical protein